MNEVVDTFAALMGTVFADFKDVTMTCASDLRSELAGHSPLANMAALIRTWTCPKSIPGRVLFLREAQRKPKSFEMVLGSNLDGHQ